MKRLFFLVTFWCGGWVAALAQSGPLSGTVTDKQGEPLPGASVEIVVRNSGVKKREVHLITGLNGSFVVRHIEAGHYTLSVKYVGFERHEEEMDLDEGKTRVLTIAMEPRKAELTAINVSAGSRGSERSSQLADRRADIVQNSLSARAIEVSPDLTVANTAQRVSGVSLERSTNGEGQYVIIRGMDKRYIYTLVNGVKIPSPDNKNRYVPLDIFPADMLERLEIFKSLTPNMESDAIGGAVNMIMKDAPAKFSVNANAALGYADKFFSQDFQKFDHNPSLNLSPRVANGPSYEATMKDFPNSAFSHNTSHNPAGVLAGLSLGGRLFKNKLGVLVAGSYQSTFRNVNSIYFENGVDKNNDLQLGSVEGRHYSIQEQRSGLHARLDYQFNDKNKISLYGAYLNLVKEEFRFASDTNLILARTGLGYGRVNNSYRDLYDRQQIAHATLKGQHTLASNLYFDWTADYSRATLNRPDEATLNVDGGLLKDNNGQNSEVAPILQQSSREFTHSTDEDKSGYANLTYKSTIGEVRIDWTAGGMYRDKHRTASYDDYELRPVSTAIPQQYNGDINQNSFYVFNGEGTSDDALNYTAEEKVGAGYGMARIDWNKFLITGGVRYEHTQLNWNSNVENTKDGKTGQISYYDVLPSGNIKYALDRKQALRLSYYSAISRPNFYEVVPHIGGDPDADHQEMGNPNLKRTTADNFDLRYEYFPRGLDQLQAGVFYKRLKNPIEYSLLDSGTNVYNAPQNFGNATNYGAEIDITKYWRWFGIRANYTFTHSSITTTKEQNYVIDSTSTARTVNQTRPLQGQAKHIANLSLLFKDDNKLGLNAQLAFGFTSKRIDAVSQYYNNDVWQKDFTRLDFSVEKRLSHRWYVYAKVNNILNTPYELEVMQPYITAGPLNAAPDQTLGKKGVIRKDTYGANYLLGVKFKL